MARHARASRESVAYKEELYRAQAAQGEQLRVVKTRSRRRTLKMQHMVCIVFSMCVAGVLLYGQVRLTSITQQIGEKTEQLDALNNEYISLNAQQGKELSLSYVEEYAQNELGMVKLDNNATEYVEMNNPDRIEISTAKGGIGSAISGFVKSFSMILEYLS